MKYKIYLHFVFALYILANPSFAQEYKTMKLYRSKTGNSDLKKGCWLKKDRTKNTEIWKSANLYNLSILKGDTNYKTISEKRDFYFWYDEEVKRKGYEINWPGISALAAKQLSQLDHSFICFVVVRNKEVVSFAREGTDSVFAFAFPVFKSVYFSDKKITGMEAEKWDFNYGQIEQCLILKPLFRKLSNNAIHKLGRMAGGKGFYSFGVPKDLRFTGEVEDCNARLQHGLTVMIPYYLKHKGK